VHYNYGLLLAQIGRDAEAEIALQKALSIDTESIDYLYALIDFYYKRARPIEALELAEQLIAVYPENRLGHDLKAVIQGQ
jgi:tetratricopeptide (TPR) repeat protein